MQKWIKFIELDQIADDKEYFLGKHYNKGDSYHEHCSFIGRGLNGKVMFTSKPGIAIRFKGIESIRTVMQKNEGLSIIQIPDDADRRWQARKPSKLRF